MIPLPLPWKLLALAFVLAAAWTTGWRMRGTQEAGLQARAQAEAHQTYVKTVEGWQAAAQEITRQREEERTHAQADRREWQQKLAAAAERPDRLGPGLAPPGLGPDGHSVRDCRDRPVVQRGLWNDALAIGLPQALRPWQPDGPPGEADPPAVPLDTALENLADNGAACNDLRGQILAWQAWARSIGAAPPP